MTDYNLKTKELLLAPIVRSDADYFFETWNDLEFRKFLFDDEFVPNDLVLDIIEKSKESFNKKRFGMWKVVSNLESQKVGFCGFRYSQEMHGEIELLYGIERKFWGNGLAFKASCIALSYFFKELEIEKLVALANIENQVSWEILEKLNMRFTKEISTKIENLKVYEVSKEDFLTSPVFINL